MNRGLNDDLSRILTFVTVQVYQSLVTLGESARTNRLRKVHSVARMSRIVARINCQNDKYLFAIC